MGGVGEMAEVTMDGNPLIRVLLWTLLQFLSQVPALTPARASLNDESKHVSENQCFHPPHCLGQCSMTLIEK